jgi:hypothetical protein
MVMKRFLRTAIERRFARETRGELQPSVYAAKRFGQRKRSAFFATIGVFRNERDTVRICRHRGETFRNVHETHAPIVDEAKRESVTRARLGNVFALARELGARSSAGSSRFGTE